jgi:hypothetical protein
MSYSRRLAVACLALALPASAHAAVLDWSITADNAFSLYISSNNATVGTLVYSNLGGPASQWGTVFTGIAPVIGTEYIHIVGYNYTSSNGLWSTPGTTNGGGDNPDALIGAFTVSGGSFANGTNSLLTGNNGYWSAVAVAPPVPDTPSTAPNPAWQTPTGPVNDYGANGVGPWGSVALPAGAQWIWSDPDNGAYADFSAVVTSSLSSTPTPLPGALPLFASSLGALGLLSWRRKRKAAAV